MNRGTKFQSISALIESSYKAAVLSRYIFGHDCKGKGKNETKTEDAPNFTTGHDFNTTTVADRRRYLENISDVR